MFMDAQDVYQKKLILTSKDIALEQKKLKNVLAAVIRANATFMLIREEKNNGLLRTENETRAFDSGIFA
jgi:exopolysaccharide biosynthesis predicted pyruvyltransferase EpsI